MLNGTIRTQIDQIWNAFWSGGVSNPLSVIEQLTFLLFIKRLDELHTNEENKAEMLGINMERRIFPEASNPHRPRAFGGKGAEGMKKGIPSTPSAGREPRG